MTGGHSLRQSRQQTLLPAEPQFALSPLLGDVAVNRLSREYMGEPVEIEVAVWVVTPSGAHFISLFRSAPLCLIAL